MKKSFLLVASFFACATVLGQQTDTIPPLVLSKEALIKKSRTQKLVGWLMVGTGVPVIGATLYFLTFPGDAIEKDKVVLALVGSGVYTFIGINLINAGRRNKEKALTLSLREQELFLPFVTRAAYHIQPAISFSLHF